MFDKSKKLTKEIWWMILLTGIAGTIFGLIALFWPAMTLVTLVYIVAVVAVIGGAVVLFEAISRINKDRLWWLALVLALLNIGVGVYLLRNPLVAAAVFVVILAIVILGRSIFDLVVASYMDEKEGRWLWVLTGVLGIIAAVAIVFYPVHSSLAFTWVLGVYALIHGVTTVGFAVQIHKYIKKLK